MDLEATNTHPSDVRTRKPAKRKRGKRRQHAIPVAQSWAEQRENEKKEELEVLRSAAGGPRLPRDRRGRIAKGAKLHRFAPPAPHHISTQLVASSSSESESESSDQDVGGASTGDVMDLVRMADAPASPTARPHEGQNVVGNEEADTERARLRSKDKEWLINEVVALRAMTSQLREQVASTSIELHSLKEETKRKKNTARRNASRRAKRRAKHMELDGDLSAAPPARDSCQADDEAAAAVKNSVPPR